MRVFGKSAASGKVETAKEFGHLALYFLYYSFADKVTI
jgi:hypothetical protein